MPFVWEEATVAWGALAGWAQITQRSVPIFLIKNEKLKMKSYVKWSVEKYYFLGFFFGFRDVLKIAYTTTLFSSTS